MKAELEKISDRLFDTDASIRAAFERSIGRPIGALSDAALARAFDYAKETKQIIAAEMWSRVIRRRWKSAPKSPAEKPVVARRDDAPIP